MVDLPPEAERLLAVAPDRFVAERRALAKELRDGGRAEDAKAVEALKKPPAVVLAVNRAARDRPKAAETAAAAAERVRDAQVVGDAEGFRGAVRELDSSLDLLADVALAQLSPPGKNASEAMRRRVHDLLRAAVADDDARGDLVRGVQREEIESAGFSPFAGMAFATPEPKGQTEPVRNAATEERESEQRARVEELREEVRAAELELEAATKTARDAERARAHAEKAVESARKKLGRAEQR